mgnify:CR=1 FL=1
MKAAAATGLSIVCASCERYWEARARGLQGDRCTSTSPCGSPMADRAFPEYRGLMTEQAFARFCFVCGLDAVGVVKRQGGKREIGVCVEHAAWLRERRVEFEAILQPLLGKPERNYLGIDTADLKGKALPKETSLLGEMLKTEKEWSDQYGWEFRPLDLLGNPP